MASFHAQPGGARVQDGTALDLTTPVQEGGVTLFRRLLSLRIPLDAHCDGLALAPSSRLEVAFQPRTVTLAGAGAWASRWEEAADRLDAELVTPASIVRARHPTRGQVAFHRVDGEAVAEQPSASGRVDHALPEPFVAVAFQAVFSGSPAAKRVDESVAAVRKATSVQSRAQAAPGATAWGMDKESVQAGQIQANRVSLDLAGVPTSPRLRLSGGEAGENLWQWLVPGEQPAGATYAAWGEDLVKALQPALDRAFSLRAAGADALELPFTIESDAPCGVVLTHLELDIRLRKELLSEPARLDFSGGGEETRALPLSFPAGQPLELRLEASLVTRGAGSAAALPAIEADKRHLGAHLEAGASLAVPWQAEKPSRLAGFAVAWHGLTDQTELGLALFPDQGGRAAAKPLLEGRVEAATAGSGWLRCVWEPGDIQPGRYWLRVQVRAGAGLWLGENSDNPQSLWSQIPPDAGGDIALPLDLLRHPLEWADAAMAATLPLGLSLNGAPLALSPPDAAKLTASLAPVPPAVAGAWLLAASSLAPLSLILGSVCLTYRP